VTHKGGTGGLGFSPGPSYFKGPPKVKP